MDVEVASWKSTGTYVDEVPPPGANIVSGMWIFRVMRPPGSPPVLMARYVACGFSQRQGVDFFQAFSPTLRVMLGMAANRGWRIKQMDITTAFLNGIILEELYMLQPEGLDDGSGRVCRLKKAIYGLKQAPCAWYHKLEETLLAGGFKKSECDHSLFLLQDKEQFLMLLVFVDDILLFSKSSAMIEHVEEMLEMQFKCSNMGDVKYYLGMHVERDLDKGVLRLHQRKGVPLTPVSPLLLLRLLSTSLALRRSGLRLLPVGGTATARAGGARVVEGTAGAAAEVVEEAEGVAVEVGVVPGVGSSVAAVEVVEAAAEVVAAVAAVVEAAAAVVEVAAAVVLVEVQPRSVEALVVASASSSRVPVRPRRPRSFFPDAVELPRWGDLLRQNVAIFDLDFDAILAAMYAVTDSAEGGCYLSVPPDPGIEAAALGASAFAAPGIGESAAPGAGESALYGTAPTEALHTCTLDSGASRSFFRDSTTLTPLSRPVAVSLAEPSGGPVLAHSSTVLPCPAAPSGLLLGLHLPSFSTNLVSGADLQDAWVDHFTRGGQRVTHCTCSWMGRHLATFTRRHGSSLYTPTTASPLVTASGQVAASSQVFAAASRSSPESAPCSCRPLSHETVLWHHRLGHPSLSRLRGMACRTLVSGLPRSLPPLPPGPAPTCVQCVEGRQRAAPQSSTFPPMEAPLETLHMDVKGEVTEVLIDWIRGARRQLSEHFGSDLPVLRLHSDRGGEFSSDLLRAFCPAEGIRQTFTLPASPQKNGIAERHIGMVMDVAHTSMIHAAAPHFLWSFAVQYAAHQINLQPRVSLPETTPTLRWTGKVGDVSLFRVWGSQAFVRDTSADKLSSRAVPCVFLGFPPDAPGWLFYHPTSRRVLSSPDVTFDESVSYYRLFPYRTASLPPPPLFLAPGTHPEYPLPPQGPAPLGVSQVDLGEPVEVAIDSGAARGAEPAGVGSRGAEPGVSVSEGAEPGSAEPESVEPRGADSKSAKPGGAEPKRALSGGPPGVPSRWEPLSLQQLREWYARRCRGAAGTAGAAGAAGAGGAAGVAGGAADAGAAGGAAGAGVAARAAGGAASAGAAEGAASAGVPAGASGPTRGLTERHEPESHPVSPQSHPASPESRSALPFCSVHGGRHVSRQRPPPAPGTHSMTLRPSSAPQHVPLPSPPASSLLDGPDPESDSLCAASPNITRFLATAVTDPLFESSAASALVAELVDFVAACRLDYATSLVAQSASASVCPPSVGGECDLDTDVLQDRQEDFECFAATVPPLVSMMLAPEGDPDAPDIPTPRSYTEAIEGPYSS
ncbi:unnamed protein product [Closterium sp. NIES-54]